MTLSKYDIESLLLAKAKAKRSLYYLAHDLLGFKDITRQTHGEIIKSLEGPSKRKMIVVPRGCLKSTIACVAYPIWLLINDPNKRIMIDSEVYTNSKNFIREIKGHLESHVMTALFGEFKGATWNEGELIIRQRNIIKKEASITASGIGAEKTGQHYDYIIMDDLNSPNNSNTPEACEKVINHFRYNGSICEQTGTMSIIGTRYAANDLIGHVLETQKHNYKKVV